jgi:hypothetical protein
MRVFVQLLKDQKCRAETAPIFKLDPISIVTDKDGRVYGSGSGPQPYKLKMSWCNYEVEGKGQVDIAVAKREPETSGFRFRPKAAIGYLPVTAYKQSDGYAGLDAGVLIEPAYVSWFNFNAYVGFRSVGGGFGFDLTRNMGAYVGYAITWGTWQSNLHGAISFALW